MKLRKRVKTELESNGYRMIANWLDYLVKDIDSYYELTHKEQSIISEYEFNKLFCDEFDLSCTVTQYGKKLNPDSVWSDCTYNDIHNRLFKSTTRSLLIQGNLPFTMNQYLIDDSGKLNCINEYSIEREYLVINSVPINTTTYIHFHGTPVTAFWDNVILPKCNQIIEPIE